MSVWLSPAAACPGDCDGNGEVRINELVVGVNILLGTELVDACRIFDADGNGSVDVNELVLAVNRLLDGCDAATPTQGPTPTPTVPLANCGNGVAADAEECDDGNRTDGDGCSANCQLEPGGDVCAGVATRSGTALRAVLVSDQLRAPLYVTAPPLDPHRIFIVEQTGLIRIVKNGGLLSEPFLNLTTAVSRGSEQGLLGLAFHPDYEANGRFFVNYTDRRGDTIIARYRVSADPDIADPASAQTLLMVDQPFSNHNGGHLAFGPDGYLYAGLGDGGGQEDPAERGQRDDTLLGKMLRLDVDVDQPPFYAVPTNNPNAGVGAPLGLIWAKGLRNPWRYAFDRLTGGLFIGDVGQYEIEEIDYQPAGSPGGENYGWDIFEGSQCFEPTPLLPSCPDPPTGYVMPVIEYDHEDGCSVTGGYVYRGCALPELRGTYFYSDYCTAFIRSFVYAGGVTNERDWTGDLAPGQGLDISGVSSFGEDARGELYICDIFDGEVFKIVAAP